MKVKVIKNVKDIRCGDLVIRACVNLLGDYFFEVIKIASNPWKVDSLYAGDISWKVKTEEYDSGGCVYSSEKYVGDLLGYGRYTRYTKLYHYTSELHSYLKSIGDVFSFLEFLKGKKIDLKERSELSGMWKVKRAEWEEDNKRYQVTFAEMEDEYYNKNS